MCTLEYLPMVKEVFEDSLRRAARAHTLRREFFTALSKTKLGPPVELEEASHRWAHIIWLMQGQPLKANQLSSGFCCSSTCTPVMHWEGRRIRLVLVCSTATFDIVSEECPLLLMIDLPAAFPQQKPRLTLQVRKSLIAGTSAYSTGICRPVEELATVSTLWHAGRAGCPCYRRPRL